MKFEIKINKNYEWDDLLIWFYCIVLFESLILGITLQIIYSNIWFMLIPLIIFFNLPLSEYLSKIKVRRYKR